MLIAAMGGSVALGEGDIDAGDASSWFIAIGWAAASPFTAPCSARGSVRCGAQGDARSGRVQGHRRISLRCRSRRQLHPRECDLVTPDPNVTALIDGWSDVIEYHRHSRKHGAMWTCTLHMHDAENIIIGEGITREDAERDALVKAGRLPKRARGGWRKYAFVAVALAFALGLTLLALYINPLW
jgi:hypothetical protein